MMTREEAINTLHELWRETHDPWYEETYEMAIEALKVKTDGDLISRQDAIDALTDFIWVDYSTRELAQESAEMVMGQVPSAEPKTGEWIPVKWHEITDEEREREGYPKDWAVYIDCEMPCDEQEILVQTKSGYVRWDVCYEDGGFSLDSGWDWIEDIVAWQPLPEPYREDGEEE